MQHCEQTPGQSVWEHGISVRNHFFDLLKPQPELDWRLPKWFSRDFQLHSPKIIEAYTTWHDCGKPLCRQVDEQGRVHFPCHAETSKQLYLELFDDPIVANLIGWDMVLHTATAAQIQDYLENHWTPADALTLLLAALAEVHSNAQMFGGTSSNSFKSKWKRIDQRGRQILRYQNERIKND